MHNDKSTESERRNQFLVKLICGGGAAVLGFGAIIGGLSASKEGAIYPLLGLGIGALCLRGAWQAFGE